MMKLRQSLRNSVKTGLLKICVIITCLSGCTLSTTPTYFSEEVDKAIQDVCKKESNIAVRAKLVGSTLWVYLPFENLFEKSDKQEKYTEKFEVEANKVRLSTGIFKLEYLIKPIPEQEKLQEEGAVIYNKDFLKQYYNVRNTVLRVLFSAKRSEKEEPKFICIVTADIKNGFEIKELSYYLDLKKISYGFISTSEYQHRTIQEINMGAEIIGDKEGNHLVYKDTGLDNFIIAQIKHRIQLKFQKPEVEKNADIDKEIMKIIVYTLKTYNFKDFSAVELANLLTNSKIELNRAAIWARSIEQKF